MTTKTPAKRWRLVIHATCPASITDYSSEQKAWAALNAYAADKTTKVGAKVNVRHWENGEWALYERAVITKNGWEPA